MEKKFLSILCFLLLISAHHLYASHIRAGEITVERISNQTLTYRFTFVGYRDTESVILFDVGEFNFGDGTAPVSIIALDESPEVTDLGDNVERVIYQFDYTYESPQSYIVSFQQANRNDNVLTMADSYNTPFYVETQFSISPFIMLNRSPVLLVPPIDKAATGVVFIHNPGAFDPDGDSLAYKMVVNKQAVDLPVGGFKPLNDPSNYSPMFSRRCGVTNTDPATVTMDSITGDLIWDAPGNLGEYNTAFIIEEWRKIDGEYFRIGYITRDMQIIVSDADNCPPELLLPQDTCVVAGSLLESVIRADDPDGHDVLMESFGGVYEVPSPASYSPFPPIFQPVIAEMAFQWQTTGSHVRERPYEVQFKARDNPPLGPSLTDIQSWNITVVGPAPENLIAAVQPGRNINLSWDPYVFSGQADRMQVWRREGSYGFTPDNCQTGIPEGGGYELVEEVNINNASFSDDNGGEGFAAGATYCYRLVAVWPLPGGGESYASEEACVTLAIDVPVLTNVSVEQTSAEAGEVYVRWTSPLEIDPAQFPPPYTYELLRGTSFGGGELTSLTTTTDTVFTDTGLNTEGTPYYYVVRLYDGNGQEAGDSPPASSVWLEASSLLGAIELSWSAEVPWNNNVQGYPYHRIYRTDGSGGSLELIDSVNVNLSGFFYRDEGQYNGVALSDTREYCYFVETSGSYGNPLLMEPLLNKSQVACAQPNDTVPPCAPPGLGFELGGLEDCQDFFAERGGGGCNINEFSNTLRWSVDAASGCDGDIRTYRVYYSRTGEEGSFEVVSPDNLSDTVFVHGGLPSFAGCYKVTAVDRSGNESAFTETVCRENCPSYVLPNIITPNGDGKNDVFRPFDCPQFVLSVSFRVYNRWGKEVYSYQSDGGENSIYINWEGRDSSGSELSSGVYYYVADVTFDVLEPAGAQQALKGWVHVVR